MKRIASLVVFCWAMAGLVYLSSPTPTQTTASTPTPEIQKLVQLQK